MPKNNAARWAAVASLAALYASAVFAPLPHARCQEPAPPSSPLATPPLLSPTLDLSPSTVDRGEVRAMWVVRDSLMSPQKIRNAVSLAKKHGFNTLFVQVRGRGDAFYDSRFEPRSEQLAGQPADFDPLAVAVEEGHKAGLEVHAWLNTFFVWHQKRNPYSSRHVVNRHPEWLVQDKQGRTRRTETTDCEGAFLDPALPGVREHTKNVFLDVATRYGVDGIHFDYVRYPSESYSFSRAALAEFRAFLLPQVSPGAAAYADSRLAAGSRLAWYYCFRNEWRAWRQGVITQTVREIAEEAHRARPEIVVSAAVFPNYAVASMDKGQAWHDWLRDGFLDAACPMSYNRSTTLVAKQIRDAVAHSYGRPIIAGIGAWQMPAASAVAKGKAFRALGASGVNLFSYDGITRAGRTEVYLQKVRGLLFPRPVALPDWRRRLDTARTERPDSAHGG